MVGDLPGSVGRPGWVPQGRLGVPGLARSGKGAVGRNWGCWGRRVVGRGTPGAGESNHGAGSGAGRS